MAAESLRLEPAKRKLRSGALPSFALVVSLLAAPMARAQNAAGVPANTSEESAPIAGAHSEPEPEEPGAKLFKQAEAHYVAGDVAGALELMQRSYDASGRPELLFNLGELQRELKHCTEARKSYERYLALAQTGTRRSEAARKASDLKLECPDSTTPIPPPAPPPVAAPDRYWTPMRIAGWSSIGASVVFATTAAYFAGRAGNTQSEYEARLASGVYTTQDQTLADKGYRYNHLAWGFGGAAVGLGAIGVSLLILNPTHHDSALGLSVHWSGDGATAAYRGAF
jgi:hypothetical protein